MLSLNSLADRRGLAMTFSDLKALLDGCSSLEVGPGWFDLRFDFVQSSSPLIEQHRAGPFWSS